MAGDSKRSLAEKLGIKEGIKVALFAAPRGYAKTLGQLPPRVVTARRLNGTLDFIQFFSTERKNLEDKFPALKNALAPNDMLGVSWPKGSSKVETGLDENGVREIALEHGLVDVKVCAVDETWWGLKLVRRLKDRK